MSFSSRLVGVMTRRLEKTQKQIPLRLLQVWNAQGDLLRRRLYRLLSSSADSINVPV